MLTNMAADLYNILIKKILSLKAEAWSGGCCSAIAVTDGKKRCSATSEVTKWHDRNLYIIIIIILYPWVYSSQGLKAKMLKSKLEWLLVRNVVDHESVVQ